MPSFVSHVLSGFSLGLTTGPFCLGTCFPVLLSLVVTESSSASAPGAWSFVGKFIAGRFAAYLVLGLVSAMVGAALGGASQNLCAYAWIILSSALIAHGIGLPLPHAGLCRCIGPYPGSKIFPYVVGGLTAVNVCPPVLIAITYGLESGSLVAGLTVFGSFFVATSLFILPAGFAGYMHRYPIIGTMGRVMSIGVGFVFLWQGVSLLWRYP